MLQRKREQYENPVERILQNKIAHLWKLIE